MGAHAVSLGDRLLRPRRVREFVERLVDGAVEIAPRGALPSGARGDLLQAGPLLVANGTPVIADARGAAYARDPQGFAAGAEQFDCDITSGRHPRAAFGIARDRYFSVV